MFESRYCTNLFNLLRRVHKKKKRIKINTNICDFSLTYPTSPWQSGSHLLPLYIMRINIRLLDYQVQNSDTFKISKYNTYRFVQLLDF